MEIQPLPRKKMKHPIFSIAQIPPSGDLVVDLGFRLVK